MVGAWWFPAIRAKVDCLRCFNRMVKAPSNPCLRKSPYPLGRLRILKNGSKPGHPFPTRLWRETRQTHPCLCVKRGKYARKKDNGGPLCRPEILPRPPNWPTPLGPGPKLTGSFSPKSKKPMPPRLVASSPMNSLGEFITT